MAIKLDMLRCFCAVAEAGNLSDAANRLGRTQSAVSMMLKQLEENLGSRLFEGERKNQLSSLGQQIFHLSQVQLSQFDHSVNAIELLARAPQGSLRIAAVPSVAVLTFPSVVRYMTAQHPGAKIELRDADTQSVFDALLQGWADIGIASAPRALNGVDVSPLFGDRFGLVLSESHPLAQRDEAVYFDDIRGTLFLHNQLCDQIHSPQVRDYLSTVDITVHNTQSLLSMVREGDWTTILPYSTIRLARRGLMFRSIVDLPDTRQVYLFRRKQTSSPEIVHEAHALIQSLKWPELS